MSSCCCFVHEMFHLVQFHHVFVNESPLKYLFSLESCIVTLHTGKETTRSLARVALTFYQRPHVPPAFPSCRFVWSSCSNVIVSELTKQMRGLRGTGGINLLVLGALLLTYSSIGFLMLHLEFIPDAQSAFNLKDPLFSQNLKKAFAGANIQQALSITAVTACCITNLCMW